MSEKGFEARARERAQGAVMDYEVEAYLMGAHFGRLEGWKEAVYELQKSGLMSGEIMAYRFLASKMPKELP